MSRRRWVYTEGGKPLPEPIEVTDDWRDAPQSTGDLGKFAYDNLRATDGTDISSKTKRERYMREKGLADAADYQQTWAKAQADREAFRKGQKSNPERREALGRIAYQMEQKRRRR